MQPPPVLPLQAVRNNKKVGFHPLELFYSGGTPFRVLYIVADLPSERDPGLALPAQHSSHPAQQEREKTFGREDRDQGEHDA